MNILDKIIAHKYEEVKQRKELYPAKLLEKSIYFPTEVVSLKKYINRPDKSGIIAEFKRHSPSQGDINPYYSVEQTSISYMQAGASALSILTDTEFFKGTNEDLKEARKFNFCPILRKDFFIDEYQIIEAKSIGADAILLIAECLEKDKLHDLAKFAKSLGLEVLMEIHSAKQFEKLTQEVDLVGVNNRNLENFKVDLKTSLSLIEQIPYDFVPVSESGISNPNALKKLKSVGYKGFLIGEYFMKSTNPGKTCADLISDAGLA